MKNFLAVFALAVWAAAPSAQSPPLFLPFQGRLTDADGKPIPDGDRLIQFQIYSDPSSGSVLWAGELHRATINGGLVNVILGSKNPLPNDRLDHPNKSFFDQPLYLQITVDANADNQITAADPPLLPRQTILPVLFAAESGNTRKLQGYDWSALFGAGNPVDGKLSGSRIAPNSITAAQIADAAITNSKLGASAVKAANLDDGAVTGAKIAPGAVSADKLAPDTVLKFAQVVGTNFFRIDGIDGGWTNPPDMSITISLTSSNALVTTSGGGAGSPRSGIGATPLSVRLNRDHGGEIVYLGAFIVSSPYANSFSFQHIFTGLSPGTHTFQLELNYPWGGFTIDPAAKENPGYQSRRLQVFELR